MRYKAPKLVENWGILYIIIIIIHSIHSIQERAIQIHLTESSSKLPFIEAIFKDNTSLSSQLETYPVTRVLCDTGSDSILIPYKLFKSMGFTSRNLMPEPVYNIKAVRE